MDGACKAAFKLIERKYPHLFCFICPTHSVDGFIDNVGGDCAYVTVRGEGTYPWGEDVFSKSLDEVWEVVKFITNHHKPLALYRQIAAGIEKDKVPVGGCELKKFCDTRFGSKVSMAQRYRNVLCLILAQRTISRLTSGVHGALCQPPQGRPQLHHHIKTDFLYFQAYMRYPWDFFVCFGTF